MILGTELARGRFNELFQRGGNIALLPSLAPAMLFMAQAVQAVSP